MKEARRIAAENRIEDLQLDGSNAEIAAEGIYPAAENRKHRPFERFAVPPRQMLGIIVNNEK